MLYITSYASRQQAATEAVRELAGYGFEHIELTGGTSHDLYDQQGLLDLARENDLSLLVHNYFPPQAEDFVLNTGTGDPDQQQMLVNLVDQAVSLSQALGQSHYSMHAGYATELAPELDAESIFVRGQPAENAWGNMVEAVTSLAKRLPENFRLAVENAFPAYDGSPLSLLASPEQIFDFLNLADDLPSLGLLLDLGHLAVSADILCFDRWDFLDRLVSSHAHQIFEVHLSKAVDGRDTHSMNSPADPETAFLREVQDEIGHAPIVLEWHRPDLHDAVRRAEHMQRALARG